MRIFLCATCGDRFLKPQNTQRWNCIEQDLCVLFSVFFVVTPFLKPQRTQRWNCIRLDLQIFFSVFSVVTFFETTEDTEVELQQTRPTNIFLCVLRGYFF
jgi:hypothetical protein